jgi:hypothetical protein
VSFLYETHLHTVHSSACAGSRGSEYIRLYKERGYAGIIVTDHFYNGNTAIPRNLPWKEWVNRFYQGYEEAREEGERQGLDVFFGWEETFDDCDDYLVYGLDKAWLLEHPEARSWTRHEQYLTLRASGGCVVQAHPFRQHHYIRRVILSAGCVDAVEAANGGNHECSYDALAMRYARRLGLPVTAGSDIHETRQFQKGDIFGVYLDKKMRCVGDYAAAVRDSGITGLAVSPGRCDYHGDEKVSLPVEIRGRNDRNTGKSWKELLGVC